MGRLSANLDSAQRSYVGILQRMPKPGSFASIYCTLSEHLRARPKHLCLWKREPATETFACFMGRVIRIPTAAKPLIVSLLPLEGEASCIGPSSQAQVCAYSAHQSAFLSGPGRRWRHRRRRLADGNCWKRRRRTSFPSS